MVCRNPWLSKSMSNAKGLVLSRVVYAGDTRMINKKIWDFQTPSHVSPISSARILENLVESREPSAGKSYSRRQPDRSFYSFVQRPLPLYITPLLLRLRTPRRLAAEEVDGKAAREPETVAAAERERAEKENLVEP